MLNCFNFYWKARLLNYLLMQIKQEFPVTLNEHIYGPVSFCSNFLTIAFSLVPRADNKGLVFYLCAVISYWMHRKFPCISLAHFHFLAHYISRYVQCFEHYPWLQSYHVHGVKKENFILLQLMKCSPCIPPWNRIVKCVNK